MRDFSSLESLALLSLLCCAVAYLCSRIASIKLVKLPLPPGPKTDWLGNVVDVPRVRPWFTYAQWKDVYGDLIYIRVFGNPILVLNSAAVTSDLLEKRGVKYSSRPVRTMIVELIGWDWLVSAFPYGSRWQAHRIMIHRHLPPNESSVKCHPLQVQEGRALCRRLLDSPRDFRYHIRKTAAAIVLKMTYGQRVGTGDDYITLADKALASLAQAGIFGTFLVDYIPLLKYAPAWFSFQRQALEWRKHTREMVDLPFATVKEELAQGIASKCMVSEELEHRSGSANSTEESTVKNVAATMYAAGADTVVSALSAFFLVMALHPEVQARGQEDIDKVIGHEQRLPLFTDRPRLPSIDYICYEVIPLFVISLSNLTCFVTAAIKMATCDSSRVRSLPWGLNLFDCVPEEDVYKGYRIPKGTTVLPNVWAILHDPEMYPDPLKFNPERFAPENRANGLNQLPDPAFGFGRRLCPGKYLAFDTLWIVVASVLAVYDITKEMDENGKPKEPVVEFTPHSLRLVTNVIVDFQAYLSVSSHPIPFGCTITPRSAAARELIVQTDLDA
ncbi:cytochrome P450 [Mycena pura]|uniref:Cytochrome P450 n=1 Tax=Mycena pura TaxID=153505 RepID=A0AAD6YP45_9AGAR|nr:cytochrome P450 [Mycena pura]